MDCANVCGLCSTPGWCSSARRARAAARHGPSSLPSYILFYFILFYFILFYFILFYFILFYLEYRKGYACGVHSLLRYARAQRPLLDARGIPVIVHIVILVDSLAVCSSSSRGRRRGRRRRRKRLRAVQRLPARRVHHGARARRAGRRC